MSDIANYLLIPRKCIVCEMRACTTRLGCGHSSFCGVCLGGLIAVQPSFQASKCPVCRASILLSELENDPRVAMEPEFIRPDRTRSTDISDNEPFWHLPIEHIESFQDTAMHSEMSNHVMHTDLFNDRAYFSDWGHWAD
jgi:hypothetical protein